MPRVEGYCHRCGTWLRMEKVPDRRTADWRSANRTFTCDPCKEFIRRERTRMAAKINAARGRPPLVGSQSQIDWAETIRLEVLQKVEDAINRIYMVDPVASAADIFMCRSLGVQAWDRLLVAIEALEQQDDAHWWIDNRESFHVGIIGEMARAVLSPEQVEAKEAQEANTQAAIEDSTIGPPIGIALQSPLPVEIRVGSSMVTALLPDRHESFRVLVRSLGYRWNPDVRVWQRLIDDRNGPSDDRAVELAHRLLTAGFRVCIHDSVLRRRVAAAEFMPEHTRWIMRRGEGKYTGWFAIQWARGEDYYQRAKRLPGSRYDKPYVVVPSSAYESVADFAELYDFRFSAVANQLLEQAEKAVQATRLEKLAKRLEKPKPKDGLREILSTTSGIPAELLDD